MLYFKQDFDVSSIREQFHLHHALLILKELFQCVVHMSLEAE